LQELSKSWDCTASDMGTTSRSISTAYNCSRDSCCCPVGLGYECQGHSAVMDMVELQQVRQMPVARPRTVVDERRTKMILWMIDYLLKLLVATRRSR
jgi:hypothetical protein